MHTHTHSGHRRLALLSLYASLCSVFALQLAYQWYDNAAPLTASATEVSALPGDRNLTIGDLHSQQMPSAIRGRARTEQKKVILKRAAGDHAHQARTGR